MHVSKTPAYEDSPFTTHIKNHKHLFCSLDGHDKKHKASLLIFTTLSFFPVTHFTARLFHTPQRCKSLRRWPQALDQIALFSCQRAEEGVTALSPEACHNGHSTHSAISANSNFHLPQSPITLLLWVTHWLAAGLTRQSPGWILHFAVHFMKATPLTLPLPISATNSSTGSKVLNLSWGFEGQFHRLYRSQQSPRKDNHYYTAAAVLPGYHMP